MLKDAGLLVVVEDTDGHEAYLLTTDGRRLSRMLAMVEGHQADDVLEALIPRSHRQSAPPSPVNLVSAPSRWQPSPVS
jgi:hypothetical protein